VKVCNTNAQMAVTLSNYDHRGGGNYGIVLCCPTVVAQDHLVYFDYNRERGTWVIRDFIAGQRLDNNHSVLTAPQIEGDATYDEFPIWCNAETNPVDWRTYLTLRTNAVGRISGPLRSTNPPNPNSGNWQPI
jgi:hypothetical protein